MEFCNSSLIPCKLEYFESSVDLCPLESCNGFNEMSSIAPLSESNRSFDECIHCYDRPDYECVECACQVCGHKTLPGKRYRCTLCKKVFHEWCQNNSSDITSASDHWHCMNCKPKDLVAPNDDLLAVKYSRQIIIRTATRRKFNNASRTSECTIVPANHFGPIPNIPVGTCWEYRLQASEAGVHRPLVAGIHGRENEGAYSIVLSGVYPDDFDNGYEFFYSGCGGKAKDPSKRLGAQIRNQLLTKQNRALALCCDCELNDIEGGEAKNWKKGKPVRVIRNYKLSKFSKYAPKEGNRYDGIYKVVKYFPQKGHSGYMIWRYLLRRDDPTPPPWTPKGKRLIEQQGLKMIKGSPDFVENSEDFESTMKIEYNDEEPLKKTIKRVRRRKITDSSPETPAKRPLLVRFPYPKPPPKIKQEFKQEFKQERMSPPPTPEPITISEDTMSDIKHSPSRLSIDDVDYSTTLGIKSSPTHEPMTPLSIKSPELVEEQYSAENGLNSYLQITPMEERSCVSNTYSESPALLSNGCIGPLIQNVHSTSTSFTQSISSLSYLDNAYIPPPLPNHCFLNSSFPNMQLPKPLPIMNGPPSNLLSSDSGNDFGFKPIKLTKPKPKITEPVESEPLPIENTLKVTGHIKDLISKDTLNKCWWDLCLEKYLPLGEQSFIDRVRQIFTCPCCLKLVEKPVTLKCESRHNACLDCINHRFDTFKARSCPSCQELFGPSIKIRVNDNLSRILAALLPDYN